MTFYHFSIVLFFEKELNCQNESNYGHNPNGNSSTRVCLTLRLSGCSSPSPVRPAHFVRSLSITIIAPQAPLEESATTEASRRCSLTGMLTGIRGSFGGQVLEAFATSICVLTVQNPSPELLRIGWILSVCLLPAPALFFSRLFDDFYEEFY